MYIKTIITILNPVLQLGVSKATQACDVELLNVPGNEISSLPLVARTFSHAAMVFGDVAEIREASRVSGYCRCLGKMQQEMGNNYVMATVNGRGNFKWY